MESSLSPPHVHPHESANKLQPGLSTFEKRLDKFDDAAVTAGGIAKEVYSKVSEHKAAIAAATKAMLDAETLDAVTRTARDILGPAKKVMEGLDALGSIHPFVKVAVLAFNAVVTLELKRRENDKRICALLLKQADMMLALLQLADIKDPYNVNENGETIAGRMEGVLKKLKGTIGECGNAVDAYYKQKFIVKFFKAHSFESKFMGFSSAFDERKAEIQFALQINVAVTIQSMGAKIDTLLTVIFQQQTSRERNLALDVEALGGKEKVLEDPALLSDLVIKTEPPIRNDIGDKTKPGDTNNGSEGRRKPAVDPSIIFALRVDLDVILKENRSLFELTIAAQTEKLESAIQASETRVIAAFQSGPYDRIKDPDIRAVWKEMNWRSSVKARHFIFALHDYYIDKLTSRYPARLGAGADEQLSALNSASHTPALSQAGTEINTEDLKGRLEEVERDTWCLPYLSVMFAPAILEAVDDDSSSFVKIKEVNDFASSRPHGWSLPQWMAYWALGWTVETNVYMFSFNRLVAAILGAAEHVLPENRNAVRTYTDGMGLYDARRILNATKKSPAVDADLLGLVRQRMQAVEARLEHRLGERKYVVDATQDVEFICGSGRIEKFICPVLYLLVKHHYGLIKLASRVVLDERELWTADQTLSIFTYEMLCRMDILAEGFRQQRLDTKTEFAHFANGLFGYMWEPPEYLANDPPNTDGPGELEGSILALVDSHSSEEDELTVDSLRFAPITIPVDAGGMQGLLDGYRKSGLSVFTPELQKYIELCRRRTLNVYGDKQLNPELTEAEISFIKNFEATVDEWTLSVYLVIAHLEYQKVPMWQVICDNCRVIPVQGPRYVCLECTVQFDLCGSCESLSADQVKYDKQTHPDTHNLILLDYPVSRWHLPPLKDGAKKVLQEISDTAGPSSPDNQERVRTLSALGKLKLGRSLDHEDRARETASTVTVDVRIEGLERRLERLEKVLSAIAGKLGVEIV